MGSEGSSSSSDCGDIDYLYSTINSVKIYPRFHFVEFMGDQFECDHPDTNYNASMVAHMFLDSVNYILGNFVENTNGGSQIPNNGESKIRFYDTPDVYDCSNLYFWDSYEDYEMGTTGESYFDIVFTEKLKSNGTYGMAGEAHGIDGEICLYNIHHKVFVENKQLTDVVGNYDGLLIHELFHVFDLNHIWLCSATCGDIDPVIECGGTPPMGDPCGSACEQLAGNGVYNNSNNVMGYNGEQNALATCQYAMAFDAIIREEPWKTVEYAEPYVCEDIIIDQSYEPTTVWECDKYLECNLEIMPGRELIFEDIKVEMGAGTSIILHPGSRLIVNSGLIKGIENEKGYWKGIRILKGDGSPQYNDPYQDIAFYSPTKSATLIMKGEIANSGTFDKAVLRHAEIGVLVGDGFAKYSGGAYIDILYTRIEECEIGLQFEPYSHYNKSRIDISEFKNDKDIIIKTNHGFEFDQVAFSGSTSRSGYGIITYNSTIDNLLSPTFTNKHIGLTILGSHPTLPGYTIGERGIFNTQSKFIKCDIGIAFNSLGFGNVENMNIRDTKFTHCDAGILIWGESEYNIYDNIFSNDFGDAIFVAGLSTGSATNDCYCNTVVNTSQDPGSLGFGFSGNNSNTSIFSNTFSFPTKSDECIKTLGEGDIFGIQATQFDPSNDQINENYPASNDFKDIEKDLLIDEFGSKIRYLTPQDGSLVEYFPDFESNYTEQQSLLNPLSCENIVNKIHEPDTLVVGGNMPTIVKEDWPDPIGDPEVHEEYIDFILSLPPGTINEADRDQEISRANYAMYNAVIASSTYSSYLSTLQQLSGSVWKRILYGQYLESENYSVADNVLQNMSTEETTNQDFIFLQEIVVDKKIHVNNEVQIPFVVTNTEETKIRTIIDAQTTMSGYASALLFDLTGEVVVPTDSNGAVPRASKAKKHVEQFHVYPNPSFNRLYVEGLNIGDKIDIFDWNNKLVASVILQDNGLIDISQLKSGIYFVKSGEKKVKKLIKY